MSIQLKLNKFKNN